jgi:class 3 adenylate cyclase
VRDHRDAARPIVAGRGGRIVKTMGDGLLSEFQMRNRDPEADGALAQDRNLAHAHSLVGSGKIYIGFRSGNMKEVRDLIVNRQKPLRLSS